MGFSRQEYEVVCHFLLQWTTFCQISPPWPARLGWPHTGWLSFIELDRAVVLVWLYWLVFCDYGFSVPSDALLQHLWSYLGFSFCSYFTSGFYFSVLKKYHIFCQLLLSSDTCRSYTFRPLILFFLWCTWHLNNSNTRGGEMKRRTAWQNTSGPFWN